jgi:hypothetical protein
MKVGTFMATCPVTAIGVAYCYYLRTKMPRRPVWPDGWHWELELTPHLMKRMEDRNFNELDLRRMLEYARAYRSDLVEGRWVIEARHQGQPWEVIMEPDESERLLVVITAYLVSRLTITHIYSRSC